MYRTVLVAAAAAAAASALIPGALSGVTARELAPHSYVIRGNTIGGFKTATDGYATARRLFGGPFSSTQSRKVCTARWGDGLVLTFKRRLPYSKFAKACRVFLWGRVTGKKWTTNTGLRIGAAEKQIKRRHPNAIRTRLKDATKWTLTPDKNPALEAWVTKGRVSFFRIVRSSSS